MAVLYPYPSQKAMAFLYSPLSNSDISNITYHDIKAVTLIKIRLLLEEFLADGGYTTYKDIINDPHQDDPSVCLRFAEGNLHRNAVEMARQLKNSKFPLSSVADSSTKVQGNMCLRLLCPHHVNDVAYERIARFTHEIMKVLFKEVQRQDMPDVETMMRTAIQTVKAKKIAAQQPTATRSTTLCVFL